MLPRAGHGFVYKVSAPSGKAYIGQTVQAVATRFQWHCYKNSQCRALKAAIAKYGTAAMKVETLAEVPVCALNDAERQAIARWGTYDRGYNMTPGGDVSPMTCPEVAARMRATLLGPSNAKLRASLAKAAKRPEVLAARSKGLKRAHAKAEVRARYKAAWKAAQSKPEAKDKQRIAQRKAHQNPEIHARRMAGLERMRNDPVKQAARAQAIKDAWARKRAAANLKSGTITSEIRPGSQYAASCAREGGERCVSPSLLRPPSTYVWRG